MKRYISPLAAKAIGIIMILPLISLWSCNDEGDTIYHNVKLSLQSYTFQAENNSDLTITVTSNPSNWSVDIPDNDWLSEVSRTANSITLSADDNTSVLDRSITLTFQADGAKESVTLNQLGTFSYYKMIDLSTTVSSFAVTTRNGKYIADVIADELANGDILYTMVVVDTETGDMDEIFQTTYSEMGGTIEIISVNNDLSTVILSLNSFRGLVYQNGRFFEPEAPSNSNYLSLGDVTPDGSAWIGFCFIDSKQVPTVWVDNKYTFLELPEWTLADPDEDPESYPVEQGWPLGISQDGNIIYGSDDNGHPLVWIDGELRIYGQELWENFVTHEYDGFLGRVSRNYYNHLNAANGNRNLSPDGKLLACTYISYELFNPGDGSDDQLITIEMPAVVNIETGDVKIFEDIEDGRPLFINNEGIMFLASPLMGTMDKGYVLDTNTGVSYTTQEWFHSTLGMYANDELVFTHFDNSLLYGMRLVYREGYGITPIPFYVRYN